LEEYLGKDQIGRMLIAANVSKIKALADIVGVAQNKISMWKKRGVPGGEVFRISQILNCSATWILSGEGEMRPSSGSLTANTNEPELVRACEVEWSMGHKAREPLKLTHDEVMMVEFMRELDAQDRVDIMDTIREAWLLKRHKQNPTE